MSSHQAQYYPLPPPPTDNVRLPSIKDLNFPPPGQEGAPANSNGPGRPDSHSRPRHEQNPWARSGPSTAPPHPQHSPNMPPPPSHEAPSKSHSYAAASKPDASYAQPAPSPQQSQTGLPLHNGVGAQRPEKPADASSQRSRSQQSVGASPGRSPHNPYPSYPPQQPPSGYHQHAHPTAPPPPDHPQQPPSFAPQPPPPGPGYAFYPPPPMRYHTMGPPPAPAHHQAPPPPNAYPHPPPPEHWQHHPQQQQQPPPQPIQGYGTRTTPLVQANVEARPPVTSPADVERANARQQVIAEILKYCGVLYSFANHYTHNAVSPSATEVEEMNKQASMVVRLLEDLRRIDLGEDIARKDSYPAAHNQADEQARPPKRPWEDMAREGEPAANNYEASAHAPYMDGQAQSTAEQDMQIIRNKRQSSTGGAVPGQQKNKYRKRSRATPPGKCHSCNIRETPEWRRGPDGARTLCNACGLHYAKLVRKRDKTLDANGKAPPIDLQTLRASTASARGAAGNQSDRNVETTHSQSQSQSPSQSTQQQQQTPYEQPKQPSAGHPGAPAPHTGPYQLMQVGPPSGAQPHQMMPPHPAGPPGAPVPPPPWLSGPPSSDRGAYNAEPYVRASHPPSHARASPQ